MKNSLRIVALLALVGTLALGATQFTTLLNLKVTGKTLLGSTNESNAIARSVVADIDYDFASATIVCNDSASVTATGVKIGDPCFVGIGPRDGGTAIVTANSVFMGIATADNTVVVRHCPVGTAANPVDAGYVVRCVSSQ